MKRHKAINRDGIAPVHVQSVVLVSKHYFSKTLIQLPRNTEDHAIALLLHMLRSFSFCDSSCAERTLKTGDFYFVAKP